MGVVESTKEISYLGYKAIVYNPLLGECLLKVRC